MLSCNVDRKPFQKRVMISLITLSLSERVLEKMFVQLNNSSSPIWPLQCWQTFFSRCTFSIRTEKMFYLAKKRFTERKFKKKANESDYIIYNFISLHCIFYPAAQAEEPVFFWSKIQCKNICQTYAIFCILVYQNQKDHFAAQVAHPPSSHRKDLNLNFAKFFRLYLHDAKDDLNVYC